MTGAAHPVAGVIRSLGGAGVPAHGGRAIFPGGHGGTCAARGEGDREGQ